MNPEKYISIEYNIWNTVYKPMEKEIEKLKKELEEEKENKRITFYVSGSVNFGRYYQYIGAMDMETKDIENNPYMDSNEARRIILDFAFGPEKTKPTLMNPYEFHKIIEKLQEKDREIDAKIKKLPKIIRRIFNIH